MAYNEDAAIVASSTSIGLVQRAQQITNRILEIDLAMKQTYVELGFLVLEVRDKELWQFMADRTGRGFHSWDDWMTRGLPFSRSHAYDAKTTVERLNTVPRIELMEIPRSNLKIMLALPESKRNKEEWLEKAKTMSEKEFMGAANEAGYALEDARKMLLRFDISQYDKVIEAMARFEMDLGISRKEDIVEAWAVNYLQDAENK